MTKAFVVISYTWYDKYGEANLTDVEGVFYKKEDAEMFIKKEKKKKKNTKHHGTDYSIVEKEVTE